LGRAKPTRLNIVGLGECRNSFFRRLADILGLIGPGKGSLEGLEGPLVADPSQRPGRRLAVYEFLALKGGEERFERPSATDPAERDEGGPVGKDGDEEFYRPIHVIVLDYLRISAGVDYHQQWKRSRRLAPRRCRDSGSHASGAGPNRGRRNVPW